MLGGTEFLIPKSVRMAMPYLIPFGIFGVWRWGLYLIRLVFWAMYRPIYPKKFKDGSSANKYKSSDVTIVVPTIDNGEEFIQAAKVWVRNKPYEIIIVTSDEMKNEIKKTTDRIDPSLFRVLSISKPNKRAQMVEGVKNVKTSLLCFSDDDAVWTEKFLEWMLAPFDDERMGGVGSRQEMMPVNRHPTFWEVIADFRLTMRMIEASGSTFVDGGIACLSGRTAIYRTEIVEDPEFQRAFVNEKWLGKYPLHSGDDKFLTRWIVKHGWRMQLQNHKECSLLTTFKDNRLFMKQVLRWTRNTWRSDIRSIFVECAIWYRYPYVALNMVDKFMNPFPILFSVYVILYNLFGGGGGILYVLIPVASWVFVARIIKMIPHLIIKPSHLVYIPALVGFQYIFPLLKIYAFFTLHITDWGSRQSADDDDEGSTLDNIKVDEEDPRSTNDDAKVNDTATNEEDGHSISDSMVQVASGEADTVQDSSTEEEEGDKPQRRRYALLVGWAAMAGWAACIAYLGIMTYDAIMYEYEQPQLTLISSNRAVSSVTRAAGGGVYDRDSDKTFVTYAGAGMEPTVMEYDHADERFTVGPVGVGVTYPDFHNYPKLAMDDAGHLIVTWTDHYYSLYIAKSERPHSAAGNWTTLKVNDDKPTYQCISKTSNGDIFIFYRRNFDTDYRPTRYVKSTDNGETWSSPHKFIDSGGIEVNLDPQNLNEIYFDCPRLQPSHNGIPERFAFGWTKSGGGPNATIHNNYHKDVHFAYMYPSNGTFTNVQGQDLGDMIDYHEMETCVVFDSGPLDEDNKQIVDYYFAPSFEDGTGYPIMVYNFNKTLTSSRYDGKTWSHSPIGPLANNVFDVEKVGPQSFRLYIGDGEVKIFDTKDGGSTWKETERYSPGSSGRITKVLKIPDAHPDLQLVAMENTMCAEGFEGCTQDYRGLSKVWTFGKGKLNAQTPLVDDSSRYMISMKGVKEIDAKDIREWERFMETWFLDFYHRGKGWGESEWERWFFDTFRYADSIEDDRVLAERDGDNRRLKGQKRDSRDIQSTFSFVQQKVTYDTHGMPTNIIMYDQRLIYFKGSSYAGEEFSSSPWNIDDMGTEAIVQLPFHVDTAIAKLAVGLRSSLESFEGIQMPITVQGIEEESSSKNHNWVIWTSVALVGIFTLYAAYDRHKKRNLRKPAKDSQGEDLDVTVKTNESCDSSSSESDEKSIGDLSDAIVLEQGSSRHVPSSSPEAPEVWC